MHSNNFFVDQAKGRTNPGDKTGVFKQAPPHVIQQMKRREILNVWKLLLIIILQILHKAGGNSQVGNQWRESQWIFSFAHNFLQDRTNKAEKLLQGKEFMVG